MPYLTQFNPNLWYKDPLSTNWKQTKYRKMLSKIKTEASLDRPGIWYLHCISALAACQWVTIERILGTVNVLAGGGKTNHLCSVSWEIKRLLIVFPKSITSLTRLRSWKLHHALNTAQRHCVVFFSRKFYFHLLKQILWSGLTGVKLKPSLPTSWLFRWVWSLDIIGADRRKENPQIMDYNNLWLGVW